MSSAHDFTDMGGSDREQAWDTPADPPRPQALHSHALLQGRRVVEIVHNGEVYRLQATRLGKLILTK